MHFCEDKIAQLTCDDGVKRDIHIWSPEQPKAVILAIHGAMSHAGDYVLPALYFKQRQWVTVAIDQRGHERKKRIFIPSFAGFLDDLELLVGWVEDTYPGLPIMIMGHSMGGLVATHYGLKQALQHAAIKGFVLSSPYYGNALPTARLLVLMARILAFLVPKMKAPLDDFTDVLTHDPELTARIKQEKANDYRASEVTIKFGYELLKAQKYLPDSISRWSHPLLVLISGQDHLADSAVTRAYVAKIKPALVEQHYYPDNYHENFNEVNREQVFAEVAAWAAKVLGIQ